MKVSPPSGGRVELWFLRGASESWSARFEASGEKVAVIERKFVISAPESKANKHSNQKTASKRRVRTPDEEPFLPQTPPPPRPTATFFPNL